MMLLLKLHTNDSDSFLELVDAASSQKKKQKINDGSPPFQSQSALPLVDCSK